MSKQPDRVVDGSSLEARLRTAYAQLSVMQSDPRPDTSHPSLVEGRKQTLALLRDCAEALAAQARELARLRAALTEIVNKWSDTATWASFDRRTPQSFYQCADEIRAALSPAPDARTPTT